MQGKSIKGESSMFDVTIIGAGVSGVFLAYKLLEVRPDTRILMIDKGKKLLERVCPLDQGKTCDCHACTKYFGFGGLGKSEGKFNYTNDFGGRLGEKVGNDTALQLMLEVDHILCQFGAAQVASYSTKNTELEHAAKLHGLQVLSTQVRHLGTKLATDILQSMYMHLNRVEFTFETMVSTISKGDDGFTVDTDQGTFRSKKVVVATGMSGTKWLQGQCDALGISPTITRLDLGLRVEMSLKQMDPLLKQTFETKLRYKSDDYVATTYCMNPGGRIIRKYQHGFVLADGQNYREVGYPTENINFTLFVPRYFPSFLEAQTFAQSVIQSINKDEGRIVVQRLGDLRKNQVTTEKKLASNSISPSLSSIEAGSVQREMPELYVRAFLDMAGALEGLIGEKLLDDTLLYALDAKFYEPKVETNKHFETKVKGFYLIGDCSGETHSLSQAAASGILLGEHLGKSL